MYFGLVYAVVVCVDFFPLEIGSKYLNLNLQPDLVGAPELEGDAPCPSGLLIEYTILSTHKLNEMGPLHLKVQ